MAIDLTEECTMPLAKAARRFDANPSTAWRWCRQGVRGVRLEYARVGRKIVTSAEALQRFSDRLTALDQDADAYTPATPTHHIDPDHDAEEAEAVAEGL